MFQRRVSKDYKERKKREQQRRISRAPDSCAVSSYRDLTPLDDFFLLLSLSLSLSLYLSSAKRSNYVSMLLSGNGWDCLRGIVFSVPSSLFSRKTVVSLFAKPVFEKLEITSIRLDDPRINNRLFGDCLFVRDQIRSR